MVKAVRITSRSNPKIKWLKEIATEPELRRRAGVFLCDGKKLLKDAIDSGVSILTVLAEDRAALPLGLPDHVELYRCPESVLDTVSAASTEQGVVFCVPLPEALNAPPRQPGRYLLLEDIQDPGNVGSILRSAEAFGISGVIVTPRCADPYGVKAVRAGMGAQFRLPIGFSEWTRMFPSDLPVYATALRKETQPVEFLTGKDCIVVLGNEGSGVSEDLMVKANGLVGINMQGSAESLGVAAAGAIVCYSMRKEP